MSIKETLNRFYLTKKRIKLINKLSLLLFPLTLLSTTTIKTLASEEIVNSSRLESANTFEKINSLDDSDWMSQVTNVNQLRDVSPRDWAYEALRSLVEGYGCITGFPDQTYRGNQPLSRYEFAAGLSSCLDKIEQLTFSEGVTQEDLEKMQRLSQEFEAELAIISERIDDLEARTNFLEENQFSTTTKLSGDIFFNLTGAGAGDNVSVETSSLNAPFALRRAGRDTNNNPLVSTVTNDPATTLSYYAWINLNSSFTGRDNLAVQLVAGNGISPVNSFVSAGLFNTFGTPFLDQTGTSSGAGSVEIRELFYDFPVGEKLRVVVGPRINWYRYFDNNRYTFFLTGASSFNAIGGTLVNPIDRGSGAVATYKANDWLTFKLGYLGENTEFLPAPFFNTSSDPSKGLFSGTQTLTAEVDLAIADQANLRLIYTRGTLDNNQPLFDTNGNLTGFGVGGATGEPIYGVADDGFGGTIGDAPSDTFAVNFDWAITERFGVFGRYNYGSTDISPQNTTRSSGEVNAQAFQGGVAFPDLGKEGALGTLSFVIPFDVLDGEEFLASGNGDGGTQYEFEATYFYPVNRNLAIVPAFYFIANPNNFESNPSIFVGNLRMQFRF